jgi:S1-C subfamily serine protease
MIFHRIRCVGLAVLLVSSASPLVAQVGHSLLWVPEQTEAEKKIRHTSIRKTMDRVAPAIVHVMVRVSGAFRLQRDSSGVVISPSGLVLTNWHLVSEVESKKDAFVRFAVRVKTASGIEYPAKVVAKDEGTDLVLLKIDLSQGAKLPYAKLGNQPVPGETVIVGSRPGEGIYANFIGSLSPSLTAVTVHGKTIAKADIALADANVNVFADGSPVFDINGRVLAIVNTSNVKPPLHEKSSDEERKAYRTSFGFATRVAAAKRVFAKHLEGIEANPETSAESRARRQGLADAVSRASRSVVSVRRASLKKVPKSDASDPHGKFPNDALGSGVIVHESGLVLTNAHIAGKKGAKVWVTTVGGKTYEGVVLDASSAKNTAVIKLVLPPNTKLPFLTLADSTLGQLGERVATLGNRYGHTVTAKVGVLSSKQRSKDVGDQHKRSMGHFQTDATIHNGNTGGALINADGELLGVNDVLAAGDEMDQKERHAAKMALTDTTIGFALPANVIRETLREGLTGAAGKTGHLAEAPKVTAEALKRRSSQITRVVQKHADSFLNVFVKKVTLGAPKGGLMADLFPEPADDKHFHLLGQGSGVIIDPTGLALTNWHVVDAATYKDGAARKDHKVFVSLHTGKKYEVEILSTSRIDDLALLQLKLAPGETVEAIRLGDSDKIKVGDTAIAVGNPHGFANSVTVGLVSAKNRDIRIKGRARFFRGLIQTDAAINPGNSGGALIDLNGYLIGINNAGHTREARQGFSIPVNYVRKKFHSTLLSSDKLRSVFLGMETETRDGVAFVKTVSSFGPAADAGVQIGDEIVRAQSQKISDSVHFVKVARSAVPFEPFGLVVKRALKTKKLVLEPLSDASWAVFRRANFAVKEVGWDVEGKKFRSAAVAAYREYTGDQTGEPTEFMESGLVVTHVRPDAVEAGMDMKKGDVIVGIRTLVREIHLQDRYVLENIHTLQRLRQFIRGHATKKGTKVELWTVRDGKVIKVQVIAKKVKPQ